MARLQRRQSESHIYHALLRGINQQSVFEENADYERFLLALEQAFKASGAVLLAYCLMGNHVHLLLEEVEETIGETMKRICVRYVMWFNTKYQRVGQLFQDRFQSEAVESDAYFLTVLRYIYQNPVKAGLCKRAEDYRWSSCGEQKSKSGLVNWKRLRELGDLDFLCRQGNPDDEWNILDLPLSKRHSRTDEAALQRLLEKSGARSASTFQTLAREQQEEVALCLLKEGYGLRQVARVSGLSKGLVESWKRRAERAS